MLRSENQALRLPLKFLFTLKRNPSNTKDVENFTALVGQGFSLFHNTISLIPNIYIYIYL